MMEEKKVSNTELGRAIGVSHVTIGNYLNGKMPKTDHFFSIARFFGVDPVDLYEGAIGVPALHDAPLDWRTRALEAEQELGDLKRKIKALTGT